MEVTISVKMKETTVLLSKSAQSLRPAPSKTTYRYENPNPSIFRILTLSHGIISVHRLHLPIKVRHQHHTDGYQNKDRNQENPKNHEGHVTSVIAFNRSGDYPLIIIGALVRLE